METRPDSDTIASTAVTATDASNTVALNVEPTQTLNMDSGSQTSTPQDAETSDVPQQPFPERKRAQFSFDSNELRRRHAGISDTRSTQTSPLQNGSSCQKGSSKTEPAHHSTHGEGFYECNICFDTATHPVLTICGHLFCWSCLAQWLNTQSRNPTCPVCKAGCGKDKVIPVYGRGREEKDPRNDPSIPTRPAGQRPPPLRDPNAPAPSIFGQPLRSNVYTTGNMSIMAGFGVFPFGFTFNIVRTGAQGNSQQSAFFSRLFFMMMCLLVVAVVFSG